jgi:hypothetical protein
MTNYDDISYEKNGITYIEYKSLYEGMSIKDFARLLDKSENTILNHYRECFPYNVIKNGVKLTLLIEEQIALIKSFPSYEIKKHAKRLPIEQLSGNCEQLSVKENNLQLPPAERVQIFGMLLEYMKREEDKYRQEKETRNFKLIDIFLKITGLPTMNEEKMGYILTQLSYETIKKSNDDNLKKLSLIYKENSNDNQ